MVIVSATWSRFGWVLGEVDVSGFFYFDGNIILGRHNISTHAHGERTEKTWPPKWHRGCRCSINMHLFISGSDRYLLSYFIIFDIIVVSCTCTHNIISTELYCSFLISQNWNWNVFRHHNNVQVFLKFETFFSRTLIPYAGIGFGKLSMASKANEHKPPLP